MSGEELAEFKVAVGKKIWAKAERVMKKPPDAVSVVSMPSSTLVNSNEESKVPVDLTSSDSDDTLSVLGPNTFEKICTTPDYVAGLPAATLVEFTRAAIARCSAILTEYDFDSQIRSAMPEANSRSFYISGVEFNYSLSDGFNAHDAINRLSQSDAM